MTATNIDLQEEIIEALAFNPRVDERNLGVIVDEGIITLTGTVPSLLAKWNAQDTVKNVRGVRGIVDDMVVELASDHVRTDRDIALSIEQRFASNAFVPASIQFMVKDGHVTLTGQVEWYFQLEEALAEARRVTGVTSVVNQLIVVSAEPPATGEVKRKIHSYFARTADIDANGVGVDVADDGSVTLFGLVPTYLERQKAEEAAWSLHGVRSVHNLLSVHP
jgi:osmotically-inducible protein OsmY